SGRDSAHLRAQQTHSEDVQLLPAHVLGAHVHYALEAEQRADGGRRDAVLPRTRFRDHALLTHALDEQSLPKAIVDFVRARMEQVFALEINFRAAELRRQAARKEQRRGAPGISLQQQVKSLLEFPIALR